MKRLATLLLFLVLTISLTACGSDPNVTAFKDRLVKSDWVVSLMGMNGLSFRFNEDDTGMCTTALSSGDTFKFNYTISDATENGDTAVIHLTPAEGDNQSEDETAETFAELKAEFVPGGLNLTYGTGADAQTMTLTAQEKS